MAAEEAEDHGGEDAVGCAGYEEEVRGEDAEIEAERARDGGEEDGGHGEEGDEEEGVHFGGRCGLGGHMLVRKVEERRRGGVVGGTAGGRVVKSSGEKC